MVTPFSSGTAVDQEQRLAYYARLTPHHMAPLWTRLKSLVPAEPRSIDVAYAWQHEELRPYVLESALRISAEEAERRVLILENPGLPGQSQITNTLYAGLQLIMPGELAPAHRHTQSALRFVIEGRGAFTAVEGEKVVMAPGDFVITPSWAWHHHGHEGEGPFVWLDGLDIPMVGFFNSAFREEHDLGVADIVRMQGDSLARYGSGLMPVNYRAASLNSPVFHYPYMRTREALSTLARSGDPDSNFGYLLRYVNPVDGGWAMPTIATMIRLLPAGFSTRVYRSTDSLVLVCVEGGCKINFGEQQIDLRPHDVAVVPGWTKYTLHAKHETVLF